MVSPPSSGAAISPVYCDDWWRCAAVGLLIGGSERRDVQDGAAGGVQHDDGDQEEAARHEAETRGGVRPRRPARAEAHRAPRCQRQGTTTGYHCVPLVGVNAVHGRIPTRGRFGYLNTPEISGKM